MDNEGKFDSERGGRSGQALQALMDRRSLSVVVIGRNEGQRLSRCLKAVEIAIASLQSAPGRAGSGDGIELIYVDSASTDGSPEVAAKFGAQVVVLNSEHPTAASGRNAGWTRAQGEYVLFLDGDTVVHPDFPSKALASLDSDDAIAVVWGNLRELHPEHSIYNRVLDLDWIYRPGDSEFCGGNAMIRRAALVETGGFDSGLIAGEEPDLCRRLRARGYRIVLIDCPMAGHDLNMTKWSQYWKRATRAGFAFAEIGNRYRNTEDPMWQAESQRDFWHGGFWIASLAIAILALAWNPWPLAIWLGLAVLASVRSARSARWKAPGKPVLLFLYGVHSHLQQIPILVGQIQWRLHRRTGRRQKLIEYREQSR